MILLVYTNSCSSNQLSRFETPQGLPIIDTRTVHMEMLGALTATRVFIAVDIIIHQEGRLWTLSSTRNCPRSVADQD